MGSGVANAVAPGAPAGWAVALRAVVARPALRRLEVAWAGSTAGDAMALVAFALVAYRAGGPGGVAVLVAVQMLPSALLAPLVTAAAHALPRERLALAVDVARVAIAAGAAVLVGTSVPHAALLVLAAALTIANSASNAARRALTPLLVAAPAELAAAGVVASVVQAAAQTGGPALAAVLVATSGTPVVLGAAAACFAVAALAEARLPRTTELAVQPLEAEHPLSSLVDGVHAVRSDAQLGLATVRFAAKNVGRGAMNVLVVVVPLELLGLGRSGVGWLTALVGAGGVIGGAAAAGLVGRPRLLPAMAFGLALWGAPLLVVAARPELALTVVALLVVGLGNTLTDVAGYTLIGRSARDDLLSSVYGMHEAVRAVAYTVGAAVTAAVAESGGAREALAVAGALLVAAALVGAAARGREHAVEPAADDVRALRASPLVGWLPPIALARIASTVEPLELAAGAVLLREGDEGDRAYLVVSGEVAAERGGTVIERIGCGGVVGEIALLRRTTRTATVRATTDCRLLAIEREEFLVAVGGNASAREAAGDLVERRLARVREA